MFIVLINDRLMILTHLIIFHFWQIDYCVANILIFHAYKWNADIFFLFNHQEVDIFAKNEKLLNVLISSIDRFFRSIV